MKYLKNANTLLYYKIKLNQTKINTNITILIKTKQKLPFINIQNT